MIHEERIKGLEKEIEEFECLQCKKQREFQELQEQFQQELAQIVQAILTRKGGIIELRRVEKEDDPDTT